MSLANCEELPMESGDTELPLTSPLELMTRVASLYYLDDLTQEEIADRLRLSRPKVGRLLKQARAAGIVEISVKVHPSLAMPLESKLAARFTVSEVIIVGDQEDANAQAALAGRAAIDWLNRSVKDGAVVAVGMGRNVKAVADAAAALTRRSLTIVSAIGGSTLVAGGLNSNEIAARIGLAAGGVSEGLYAPAYVESRRLRDELVKHADLAATLQHARDAEVAIVGIGETRESSLVVQLGLLAPDDMERLRRDGAVGDILGTFFNREGTEFFPSIEERVVGLERKDLQRIPVIVAVASEREKAPAILGALNSGLVDVLITSMGAALDIAELSEK
jgi:DNA-binding transcriptional regulator LsrR (DeoR family)